MIKPRIIRVAVPSPLFRSFDYLPPRGVDIEQVRPGARVKIPFGRQKKIGVVIETRSSTDVPEGKLRPAESLVDHEPLVPEELLYLARWATDYYRAPPGSVFETLFPVRLRKGDAPDSATLDEWRLTAAGSKIDPADLARAPRQMRLLARLQRLGRPARSEDLEDDGSGWRQGVKALEQRELVERHAVTPVLPPLETVSGPEPGDAQAEAIRQVAGQLDGFRAWLLDGVTGSGKTEVYLRVIQDVLAKGRQALVLVPEIGLTAQLVHRFRERLGVPLVASHSGMNDTERLAAWDAMRTGKARVLIGTRSAVWVPMPEPGIIIVDEEHDASFKQQEGFRYSARDIAVVRAQRNSIPIVLGSATPSLESLANAESKRYGHLHLPGRAGGARPPEIRLVDIRGRHLHGGLSDNLLQAIRKHLDADGQVLLFLNRRGYAPRLVCDACGWLAQCRRCDAHMTLHQKKSRLQCHHCGAEAGIPDACPECAHAPLDMLGRGTERLDETLHELFPGEKILRVDRDSMQRKGALDQRLEEIRAGEHRLLVGTQMLAKGHDFPNLTLVGVLNADHGLFGLDFRSVERLAQLVLQVAGRAGRADRPGEVLVQTHHPEHPLLNQLVREGYSRFAKSALAERREAMLPPYAGLALLRAEATNAGAAKTFLQEARQLAASHPQGQSGKVMLLGPAPAPMERRAGRYRAQLLLQAGVRNNLQSLLADWIPRLETLPSARAVRWSIDVDPIDLF